MTNRERVIATLNHQQPDAIPYHIGFTQRAREAMAALPSVARPSPLKGERRTAPTGKGF